MMLSVTKNIIILCQLRKEKHFQITKETMLYWLHECMSWSYQFSLHRIFFHILGGNWQCLLLWLPCLSYDKQFFGPHFSTKYHKASTACHPHPFLDHLKRLNYCSARKYEIVVITPSLISISLSLNLYPTSLFLCIFTYNLYFIAELQCNLSMDILSGN